ncbi:hypothetical protein ABE61_06600 [Lysinibacillus sphaericus]|uniref:hypothetical protein n=1 Tax=Lysinibacillus sphaericus TaxID=1421 RepID=UPI0018CDD39A|nr:hypothetical protein [Lysinibacillus sphaericus]MBG9453761.1 hypothetical protein [Lysinibacillus sphaericus]MBG9476231.1 hypothetical protein [Lysinibacillus sphaericus]MBG9591645.1 hypothetical protein [Lysinibacillus sphaericus]
MKKYFLYVVALLGLTIISGCSNTEEPPKAFIEIENKKFETTLGTYCWQNRCVDTAGPVELLEGQTPIKVKSGENITLGLDYETKPNKFHVAQISGNKETEVVVKDNRFTAPTQRGVYYYSYGVWWIDEKEANVSNGDAFYAFVLEVE